MLARLLFLVGGLVLIVGGLVLVADTRSIADLSPAIRNVSGLTSVSIGVITLLIGLLAVLGAARVSVPAWNIVLLVLGLFVGGLGGTLVFIAAIIGLVENYVKT